MEREDVNTVAKKMREEKIESFDGRYVKVFSTEPNPKFPTILIALPFGIKAAIASKLYANLSLNHNVVTWESRYIFDVDNNFCNDDIEAISHAYDLISVAEYYRNQFRNETPDDAQDNTHLLGYCSGAGISIVAASLRPSLFKTISLVSGEYLWPSNCCAKTNFQRDADWLLGLAAKNMSTAKLLCNAISQSNSNPQSEFHNIVSLPFSNPEYLYRYGRNYQAYKELDLFTVARKINHPTLVIASHHDCQVDISSSILLASLISNATNKWMDHGDHYELCRANPKFISPVNKFIANSQVNLGRMNE